MNKSRRRIVQAGAGIGVFGWVRVVNAADGGHDIALALAIKQYVGNALVQVGKVKLDMAELVEIGRAHV